jgi:serralysin
MSIVESVFATGSNYVDNLLTPRKWTSEAIGFGFASTASVYGTAYGRGEAQKGFAPLSARQKEAAREAMKLWDELIAVDLFETSASAADIRLAVSSAPNTAWAYLPSIFASGGDIWIGTASFNSNPIQGNYAYMTIIHEVGHALGLGHPHQATSLLMGSAVPDLAEGLCPCCGGAPHGIISESAAAASYLRVTPYDAMPWTVMSYNSYIGANMSKGYTNETFGYAQTPMARDIAAIQHLYGANYQTRSEDTIYRWSETTGEKFINGVGQGRPGSNKVFETIWDGGGRDTFDLSNFRTNLTIDLQPGGWTDFGTNQLAHLGNGKYAPGNVAVAHLHEGDSRAYIENAIGGRGHDVITGNHADNVLVGGAGNDTIKGVGGQNILIGDSLGNELAIVGLKASDFINVRIPPVDQPGNDILIGGAGNDIFIPGFGKNVVNGGEGVNTLILDLALTDLEISGNHQTMILISYEGGSVEASGIDFLALSDGIFSLTGPLNALVEHKGEEEISLLYRAGLGRELDVEGLDYWLKTLGGEDGLDLLALSLINSAEFITRFGATEKMSASEFVEILYRNVLGREGEQEGIGWWASSIENGTCHSKVLKAFALSEENRASLEIGPMVETNGLDLVAISQMHWAQIWA